MSRSKDIGTWTETAVVNYLKVSGFPKADRKSLSGAKDEGDVDFIPGANLVMAEVKGGKAAETASVAQIHDWLYETAREKDNGAYEIACLITKKKGYGKERAYAWDAHMFLSDLLAIFDTPPTLATVDTPVHMNLGAFVYILKRLGYTR